MIGESSGEQRRRKARASADSSLVVSDSNVAASLGLEPRQTDPESVVLPLHHEATSAYKAAGPHRKGGINFAALEGNGK